MKKPVQLSKFVMKYPKVPDVVNLDTDEQQVHDGQADTVLVKNVHRLAISPQGNLDRDNGTHVDVV